MKVLLIVVCIVSAMAVLCFYISKDNQHQPSGFTLWESREILWQDQISGTVEKRENGKIIPVYVGQGFDREKARWEKGVKLAYMRPVYQGNTVYIWSNGNFYSAKIMSVDNFSHGWDIEVSYKGKSIRFSEDEALDFDGQKVVWSAKSDDAAYLYFDDYTKDHPDKAICVKSDGHIEKNDWFYFTPWQKFKAEDLQGFRELRGVDEKK